MNVYTSSSGCCTRFSRQVVKPFRAYFQNNIVQRYYYSKNGGEGSRNGQQELHEDHQEGVPRAPSTADEFKRVAQEKAKQGVKSQTTDKAEDAIEDATIGDSSDLESIKQTYKEPVGKGNSHKTEDV